MNDQHIPEPVDTHVGLRVRQRRMLMGMTQSQLGDAVDISFQQIQKYESALNRIGSSRLFQMAQVLDVPVSYFFEDLPDEKTGKKVKQSNDSIELVDMRRKETLNVVQNYYSIEDEVLRKQIYSILKSLARSSK